jgi:hypothetical protein
MNADERSLYRVVYSVSGQLAAEMVRIFLESNGIPAYVFQESAGIIHGLTVGELGKADIVVPADYEAEAVRQLADMEAGKLIQPGDDFDSEDEDDDDLTDEESA